MQTLDLPTIVEARRKPNGRLLTLPLIEPTLSLEKALLDVLRPFWRVWSEELRLSIIPAFDLTVSMMTTDAMSPSIRNALDRAAERGDALVIRQTETLGRWVVGMERHVRTRTIAGAKNVTGIDVGPLMYLEDVRDDVDAAIEENVALIRGLNRRTRERVERIIWRGLIERTPRREVVRELARAMKITQKEALRIAKDQTGKVSAKFVELRQRQMGIKKYRWRTRGDDRVRPTHRVKNGKVFFWNRPPADTGHPGHDINCRCIPEAVVR